MYDILLKLRKQQKTIYADNLRKLIPLEIKHAEFCQFK